MSFHRPLGPAVLAAGLALTLVACGSGTAPTSATQPSASTSTSSATPTPPMEIPTAETTPSAAANQRTKAALTKALMTAEDLPDGFTVQPDTADEGSKLSSTNSHCAKLVELFNAKTSPGATATVNRVFGSGEDGPYVEETLEAMPSAKATTKLLATTKAAIRSCPKAKLDITSVGRSPVSITELTAPKAGTTPVAVRFTVTSGPAEGLKTVFYFTALNDVLLGLSFSTGKLMQAPTLTAAEKATRVLEAT